MGRVCHVTSAQNTGNNCGIASERVGARKGRQGEGEKIRSGRSEEEEQDREAMWRTVVARRDARRSRERGKRKGEGEREG